MPYLQLITNIDLPKDKQRALAQDLTTTAARILGKPAHLFGTSIQAGEVYSFGGTFEPAFMLHVTALNIFNPQDNVRLAGELTQWLVTNLGVSNDRGYISFYDPTDPNIGFKGTTMQEVRKLQK